MYRDSASQVHTYSQSTMYEHDEGVAVTTSNVIVIV